MTVSPERPLPFPVGKLDADFLEDLLQRYRTPNERVVLGPGIGEDAAVIDFGDRYLVAKTDPITFATDEIGWYVIHVNANDVASMGARPRWFLATILLPEDKTTSELAEGVFSQLASACESIGVALCGGHTEITYGLDRPIVVGQMLGEVEKDRLVTTEGAQVGDAVILTKGVAVEATSIIAREKAVELGGKFSAAWIDRCKDFLHNPGISVQRDAQIATETANVHAMHDPTEGGLATGLHELARAAGVGLRIYHEWIPFLPETTRLCQEYGLDRLGVIASGSLLITMAQEEAEATVEALHSAGIAAAIIGDVLPQGEGIKLVLDGGETKNLPYFAQDEIARIF